MLVNSDIMLMHCNSLPYRADMSPKKPIGPAQQKKSAARPQQKKDVTASASANAGDVDKPGNIYSEFLVLSDCYVTLSTNQSH